MKVVLDTTIIESAMLTPFGGSAQILELISSGALTLLLDNRIYAEYEEVLALKKFHIPASSRRIILDRLSSKAVWISASSLPVSLPDSEDLMFPEVAVAGKAEAIITGNKRHFPGIRSYGVHIFSPVEFLKYYSRKINTISHG